ncbi:MULTISPECIES: DMT family transporter [Bacillus amyloliquefaciens group]|uniref:DMT family transporter n=1 Tax=Bacillus amyloliquefaciens group TaxID=1938374 RepID=UPI00083D148B|nr:DMT family transporter [Bacillus velezensis]MEC1133875.1 DMT family transporter [Bacillus velezensis]ODB62908.1 transporter [Bacillus velezensis]
MQAEQTSNAVIKMVISMIIFGSIGFFSEHTNVPSIELVFVRCLCASLFLGVCWFGSGRYRTEQWNRREVLQTLACGFFLVLNWVFLFKSFEETSVTIAISVYHLAPVLVLLLGSLIYREKLHIVSVTSIVICFLGTALISGINGNTSFSQLMGSGIIWAVLAALFYAFTTLAGKGINSLSPYAVTCLQTGLGVIILLPFVRFGAFSDLSHVNWIMIVSTGIIHTGIVYLLFFDSLRFLSTRFISIIVFLDPAVAIVLDTVFTGFRPDLYQSLGIVLIFAGMALSLIRKQKAVPAETQADSTRI